MATYSFYCKECEQYFDHIMHISDLPLEHCPSCGERNPERVFQPINSKVPGGFGKSWEHTEKKN